MKSEATLLQELWDTATPERPAGNYWCEGHGRKCFRSCAFRKNGSNGAAGVLFFHRESGRFLLNLRSRFVNNGGTWSVPGGALEGEETALEGGIREAWEEGVRPPTGCSVVGSLITVSDEAVDGSRWTYTTVIVETPEAFAVGTDDFETDENRWVTLSEMATLPLHPAFRSSVHDLMRALYYKTDVMV